MSNSNKRFSLRSFGIICILVVAAIAGWAWHKNQPSAPLITRAAVDVGSGSMKVTIAKVDPLSSKIHKILYSKEHAVPFKRDLQVGGAGKFSEQIQETALVTLSQVKEHLADQQVVEWKGIATAASRQASNAQDMFDRIERELGVNIAIISQEEEGRLGFATAAAVGGVPLEQLISLDSGSGSFQLSTLIDGNLEVAEGQLGHIPSLEMLMTLRGKTLDASTPPETVTLSEAELLVQQMKEMMPPLSEAFKEKLKTSDAKVVGIGNENFIFAMGATATGKNTYSKAELWEGIKTLSGQPASALAPKFSKPDTAVLGMVLLYSIMDGMGVDEINYAYANGSCEGLLVDGNYWAVSSDRDVA